MGLRSTRVVFAALMTGAAFAACDAFDTSEGGTNDGGADGATAADTSASGDALADAQMGSDAGEADARLFFDSFENDLDCAGWNGASYADLKRVSLAQTGTRSCSICLTQDGVAVVTQEVPGAGPGKYQFEAWMRSDPSADAGSSWLSFAPTFDDGGRSQDILPTSAALAQSTSWARANASYSFGTGLQKVQLDIKVAGRQGDCILVDDVALLRVP